MKEQELNNELNSALHKTDVMCWVACSERLPDSIGSYLCFWENCYVGMLFFNSNKEWCEMWQQEKHKPTHWMPLPKPPCT